MMTRNEVVDATGDEEILFIDGFDDALMGWSEPVGNRPCLPVYDYWKMVDILTTDSDEEEGDDGMTLEDAMDYLAFNTTCAWIGERTPVILNMPLDKTSYDEEEQ